MPGIRLSPSTTSIAARAELGDHRLDVVLGPGQRLDRRDLAERRDARDGVDDQLRERVDEGRRQDRVAQPPAGHRVRLGEPVEHDRPVREAGQRRDRDVLAVVDDPAVDLVGEDGDLGVAQHELRDPLDVAAREDAAGGVRGRVDDQQPRPVGHERPRARRGPPGSRAPGVIRYGTGVAADVAGHRLVDREARVRVDDLVALLRQGEHREEHDRLARRARPRPGPRSR